MEGWIKLHRKFVNWEWFSTTNMVHIFIYLLLSANHKDGKWKGVVVKRGQMITGRKKIAEDTGISEQSVRTCLDKLKSTNEIAIKVTNKYSIITILKYDDYQTRIDDNNQQSNHLDNQQLTNNQPTTNHKQEEEEGKEEKEVNPIGGKNIFLDKIIQVYSEEHGDYKVLNLKKEREYAEMIFKEYKANYSNSDEDTALKHLRLIFNACINIDDQFKRDRMCIGFIANNYNVLKKYFNENTKRNQPGITNEQIIALANKYGSPHPVSNS